MLCRCSLIFNAFPSVLVCYPDFVFLSIDLRVLNSGILLLPFNEGSIDKPNFYCPSDVNADKTKETIIDEQILNWEDHTICFFGIDSKLIKNAYI